MKKIFLSTDFSVASEKALQYLLFLLGNKPCEFTFVYPYYSFPDDIRSGASFNFFNDIYRCSKLKMRTFIDLAIGLDSHRIHRFKSLLLPASPAGAVNFLSYQQDFDLIVTGTKSQNTSVFFGNISTDVIRRVPLNAIIVPETTSIRPLKNIVLAIDGQTQCIPGKLKDLKTLLRNHNASLTLLKVTKNKQADDSTHERFIQQWHENFSAYQLISQEVPARSLAEGVTNYLSFKEADLLVMINQKRPLFELPFHRSSITRLTLKPIIPILSIYQKAGSDVANQAIVNY